MRSGNGRHRRPRQAPAIVVAAGVTGSALALPLLAAGSASAADAATWDRVAECESGGQWSANFGNGMYGGLQFTQDSWERNGGLAYAPSPDLASRAQQIAIADKALAAGSTDWATCAPIAGLKNDGAATGINPGPTAATKTPTGPVAESNRTTGVPATSSEAAAAEKAAEKAAGATKAAEPSGKTSTAPAAPATPVSPTAPVTGATPTTPGTAATPGTPGTPSGSASATAPATPGTPATPDASLKPVSPGTPSGDASSAASGSGKHRGEAAPEETGKADTSAESGRHASSTDKLAESPAATPTTDGAKNADTTDSQGASGAYTVQPGDNLSEIAQENELPGGWNALYDANRGTVGTDPDLIVPGQSLDLTIGSETVAG